jgi:hypothetical protein
MLRITARTSLLFFLCAFVAPALQRLWPARSTRWLEANQDRSTLGFAASHTVHLAFIVALAVKMGGEPFLHAVGWVALIGGGTTYVFIYGLAAAAITRGRIAWLDSPRFRVFAHYLIWAIFARAFVGRALQSAFYVPFAFAVVAALVVRIVAAVQSRKVAALSTAAR